MQHGEVELKLATAKTRILESRGKLALKDFVFLEEEISDLEDDVKSLEQEGKTLEKKETAIDPVIVIVIILVILAVTVIPQLFD